MGDELRPFSVLYSGFPWVTVKALNRDDAAKEAFDYLKQLGYNPTVPTPWTVEDDLRIRGCRAW